jgi:hypothetical protein
MAVKIPPMIAPISAAPAPAQKVDMADTSSHEDRPLPVILADLVPQFFGRHRCQSLMGVVARSYPLATVVGDRAGPVPVVPERGQLGFGGTEERINGLDRR